MDRVWSLYKTHGSMAQMLLHSIKVGLFAFIANLQPTGLRSEFYLILNVAVGSSNGWFPENQGNKPWLDNAARMSFTSFHVHEGSPGKWYAPQIL